MKLDSLHNLIIDFIEKTNLPIFLTGKAGTGKTTFLRYIRANVNKNMAVVAPTAVAAINAGGATIHSFFQVPFGPIVPPLTTNLFTEFSGKSFGTEKAKLMKCLDLLIIDEISMVRSDVMDYINRALRFVKGNQLPFGGIQLLMIGDLYQLPPVFQNDWHFLGKYYKGPYFFDSHIFKTTPLLTFELTQVHRQSDQTFIEILNNIRNGTIGETLLAQLNQRYHAMQNTGALANYVTLTTHNPLVKQINDERLAKLDGEIHVFKAKVNGDFPKEAFPTEEELVLKAGAMVMFIKNDSSGKKQFYNGRTAKVDSISGETINLSFLDDGSTFQATQETWENNKYALAEADQKITQSSVGSFTQFPLRLAWAITIHKSQGLTFDKAVIDVGAAFAHGQTYVALSRCRTLDGLLLKEKVDAKNIITDPAVKAFMQKAQQQIPNKNTLLQALADKKLNTLKEIFAFDTMFLAWEHLQSVVKILVPNEDILSTKTNLINELLLSKIYQIAQRFIKQELSVTQIDTSNLSVRLVKASNYFAPQLVELHEAILSVHQMLDGAPFHSDYFPTLNQLIELIEVKIAAFKLLTSSGDVNELRQSMQKIVANYQPLDSWKKPTSATEKTIENPLLYAQLIDWRKQIAASKKMLGYHIFSDQTIADISAKLPKSMMQLAKIKNVGEGKTAEYGEQILRLIRQYLGENELLF